MKKLTIILILLILCTGCLSGKKYQLEPNTRLVAESVERIEQNAQTILETEELPIIRSSATTIKAETQTAKESLHVLSKMEEENTILQTEIEEIDSKPIQSARRLFVWLAGLMALTMVAGAVCLAFNQKAIAGILITTGIIGTALCFLFITFAKIIAFIMLCLFIAIIGYAVYLVWKHRKKLENQIFKDKLVKEELIETAEFVKNHNWDEGTKKTVERFQSEETKAEVAKLKAEVAKSVVKTRFNEK